MYEEAQTLQGWAEIAKDESSPQEVESMITYPYNIQSHISIIRIVRICNLVGYKMNDIKEKTFQDLHSKFIFLVEHNTSEYSDCIDIETYRKKLDSLLIFPIHRLEPAQDELTDTLAMKHFRMHEYASVLSNKRITQLPTFKDTTTQLMPIRFDDLPTSERSKELLGFNN